MDYLKYEQAANQKLGVVFSDFKPDDIVAIMQWSARLIDTLGRDGLEEILEASKQILLTWANAENPAELLKAADTRDLRMTLTAMWLLMLSGKWRTYKAIFQQASFVEDILKANSMTVLDLHRNFKKYKTEFVMKQPFKAPEKVVSKPTPKPAVDMVNSPSHYIGSRGGKVREVFEVIEAFGLNFTRGSAVKYLLRADSKENTIQDLQKAKKCIERELEILTNNN